MTTTTPKATPNMTAQLETYAEMALAAANTIAPELGPGAMLATTIAGVMLNLVQQAQAAGTDVSDADIAIALAADDQAKALDLQAQIARRAAGDTTGTDPGGKSSGGMATAQGLRPVKQPTSDGNYTSNQGYADGGPSNPSPAAGAPTGKGG